MLYFSEVNYRGNHAEQRPETMRRGFCGRCRQSRDTRILELLKQHNGITVEHANRLGFLRIIWICWPYKDQILIHSVSDARLDIQYEYVSKLRNATRLFSLFHDIQSMRRNDAQGFNVKS